MVRAQLTEMPETASLVASRPLVVIPVYNEAQNVGKSFGKLLALSTPVDAVVVDDNSPDGTGAIVEQHPGFRRTRLSASAPDAARLCQRLPGRF